jgi:hypothetical protein
MKKRSQVQSMINTIMKRHYNWPDILQGHSFFNRIPVLVSIKGEPHLTVVTA